MITKRWFALAILTFITAVAWVVFDILHARAQVEIPENVLKVIEPIDPNFNTSVLESLP